MEVDVDVGAGRRPRAPRARPCRASASPAARAGGVPRRASQARLGELQPRRVRSEVRRPEARRSAVDVAELGQRVGDRRPMYQPPPQKSCGARPCARSHSASRRTLLGRVDSSGGPGAAGAAPVRVMPERRERGGDPRPLEPARRRPFALVGRPHERRDHKACRATSQESLERRPDGVVQRPLDVARDDGRAGPVSSILELLPVDRFDTRVRRYLPRTLRAARRGRLRPLPRTRSASPASATIDSATPRPRPAGRRDRSRRRRRSPAARRRRTRSLHDRARPPRARRARSPLRATGRRRCELRS